MLFRVVGVQAARNAGSYPVEQGAVVACARLRQLDDQPTPILVSAYGAPHVDVPRGAVDVSPFKCCPFLRSKPGCRFVRPRTLALWRSR
jgi:hypothetical protein